jgi:biopolymer transport protein TolQ
MTVDSSLWAYFANAGLVVKIVMLLLLTASVTSWAYIMQRSRYLSAVRKLTSQFEQLFWSGRDLGSVYTETLKNKADLSGLEAIFQAGFREFLRLNKIGSIRAEAVLGNIKRAMRVVQMREQDKMEMKLPLLATIGSIGPYVGLFGTVWGIMLSLRELAHAQQATISMVAPGVAEALIATAMGLFAAIPAVIAYNRFVAEINRILNRFDAFQDEFANILFRQAQTAFATPEATVMEG